MADTQHNNSLTALKKLELGLGKGPKYDQIYRHLLRQIEREKLTHGDYLPPEKYLAAEFDVSIGTVRKALQKLRHKGYIQRTRGQGTRVLLPSKASRAKESIVVLMGSIKRSFFAEIFTGIQAEFETFGYQSILIDADNSPERERACLCKYAKLTGGFLVVPLANNRNHACYGQLLADTVPFVFVDRYIPEINVDAVVSDNVQGGYLATRCLLELGHRRIAVMGVARGAVSMSHRIDGYEKALSEFGLPFDESLVFRVEDAGFDGAYNLIGKVVGEHSDVTALFCLRDDLAWGSIQGLTEMGVRLPEDLSVIGYDDNKDICSRIRPRLTTVRQPKRDMGKSAARLLIRKLGGETTKESARVIFLPVELVKRESVAVVRQHSLKLGVFR